MEEGIVICAAPDCPYTKCEKHWSNFKGMNCMARCADLRGVCRVYIGLLVEELSENGN